jgi:ribosome modulation factor
LFDRHCDGARLTADERAEIADLIEAAEKSARANDLTLDTSPPSKLSKRTGLAHPISHYAELLDVGLRTVKRWLAEGVKARDACPLDDLAQFAAWWDRVHGGRAMDCHLAVALERALQPKTAAAPDSGITGAQVENSDRASAGESKEGGPAAGAPTPPAAPAKPEPARPSIALGDMAALTLDENLVKLKAIHSANVQLLERAFQAGTQAEVDARQRNVERSAKMLLDAQTALDEHLKQRGDLIPKEEIKREFLRVHTAMAQSLIGMLVQLGIQRDRATTLADSWFGHLRQSRFAATTAPVLRVAVATAA